MRVPFMKKVVHGLCALAYVGASGIASAADTDIFFNTSAKETTRPNVLFIMDTSGSMGDNPANGTEKKINMVKSALKTILDKSSDINVGLARFTVPGGPIIYPIRPIDDPATPIVSGVISSGSNDAEESALGAVVVDSNTLDIMHETGQSKWVGLRFTEMNIPQGAKITSAKLSFTAKDPSFGHLRVRIFGEKGGVAQPFAATANNISARPKTTAKALWTLPDFSTAKSQYGTDDISAVIEEVVGQSDWCGGQTIVLLIERDDINSNKRGAFSYEGAAADVNDPGNPELVNALTPQLRVQYDDTL